MGLNKEQKAVATTLEGPLFVAAGAGSGKTFTLVRRVLLALGVPVEGVDNPPAPVADSIDNICAITFTNKAAGELKERIRAALLEAGRVEDALGVDDAWISTIHGMCSRILKEHALELGLDPNFTVLGEVEELRQRALSNVIASADDDERIRRIMRVFPLSDVNDAGLAGAVFTLMEKAAGLEHGFDSMRLVEPAPADHLGQLKGLLQALGKDASGKLGSGCAESAAFLETYAVPTTDEDLAVFMEHVGVPRRPGSNHKNYAFIDEVNLAIAAHAAFVSDAFLAIHANEIEGVMELARATQEEYARLKQERSCLDNDDLLARTYEALRDNQTVREDMMGRFGLVMVDEFQDTASQQVELVRMLSGEGERALATVGDAEQSIYRFRGADVDVFRRKRAEIEDVRPDLVKQLGTNYRSHHAILDMVDTIFADDSPIHGDCLHLEACSEDTRRGAWDIGDAERARFVLTCGGSADDRVAYEAAAVARQLRALHDEQHFAPQDMVILLRGMTKADVYVQAVRAQGLPCVAAGGASLFPTAPEVLAIQALLSMLANPLDTANGALRVVTSEAFGLTSRELLSLSTVVGEDGVPMSRKPDINTLLYAEPIDGAGERALIDRMRGVLVPALARVGADPVADIVRDVVAQSGWMARLEEDGSAAAVARAANIAKALELVDDLTRESPRSATAAHQAFVSHLAEAKEAPGRLTGAGGAGAVSVMTIHSSKGLEYPVVVVSGLGSASADKGPATVRCEGTEHADVVLYPSESAPAFKRFAKTAKKVEGVAPAALDELGGASAERALMRADSKELDLAEVARLLYVGITRAREVVIVCMSSQAMKETLDSSILPAVFERLVGVPEDLGGVSAIRVPGAGRGSFELVCAGEFTFNNITHPADEPPVFGEPPTPPSGFEIVAPAFVEEPRACVAVHERTTYSYSSLAREKAASAEDRGARRVREGDDDVVERPRDLGRKDDPLAYGSAFHAAAQLMVESDPTIVFSRLPEIAAQWSVDKASVGRLDAALNRWANSSVRLEALGWRTQRAEVPFVCAGDPGLGQGTRLSEGAIDLLCTDPDCPHEAFVVDYKTGGDPADDKNTLHERHALQAGVYAHALAQAGYTKVQMWFVYVEVPDPLRASEPQTVTYTFEDGNEVICD